MLVAERSTGERVYAFTYTPTKGDEFVCPHCKTKLFFVNATKRIKHFRHDVLCPFEHEPETEDHLKMKMFFLEGLKPYVSLVDVERRFENNIADVYYELGDRKVVIECQNSKISVDEIKKRNEAYARAGCWIFWVFNTKNHFKENTCGEHTTNEKRLKNEELFMHYSRNYVAYFFGNKVDIFTFSPIYNWEGYKYKKLKRARFYSELILHHFVKVNGFAL